MAAQTEYSKDGNVKAIFTFSYEFDKKGNWIRQKKCKTAK
jgi:hypothetical protein